MLMLIGNGPMQTTAAFAKVTTSTGIKTLVDRCDTFQQAFFSLNASIKFFLELLDFIEHGFEA